MKTKSALYPSITPYRRGWLRVSPLHELYFEESGNPRGKPVFLVEGGVGLVCC
jgi:proline iminopeptidase